jgi:hypothetical protein
MNHGHVTPNADGSKARCGGPGICPVCSQEAALQQGEPYKGGTEQGPTYRKQRQSERPDRAVDQGTALYMITVHEGWRSWILCCDMYEWAADELLDVLRASGKVWSHG